MHRMPVSSLVKWGAAGFVGSSVVAFTDVTESGPFRIGRAGAAVSYIAVDYKLTLRKLASLPPDSQEMLSEMSKLHQRSAERLKALCCKNKGAFVKVGQHLGSLDYILPPEYVNTMRSLFRDAPQSPFADLMKVLESELHVSPSTIFLEIDEEPLGAASLAQVHKAKLLDGTVVAVKIQHPKVEERSHIDIAAMELLLRVVEKLFPEFQFVWLAEETKKILPMELNFLKEGGNCERIGEILRKRFNFANVPKIYWRYSTKKVLTMEYCDGGRVDDLNYYHEHKIDPNEVYEKICKMFSQLTFQEGYLHCDPHPGNILVKKDDFGRSSITLIDHGVHLQIEEKTRVSYAKLWLSLLNRDVKGMQKYGEELGVGELFELFACMLTARSWESVTHGVSQTVIDAKEIDSLKMRVGSLLPEISQVLNRVPRQVLLILKTNDLLRGLSYKLNVVSNPCSFTATSKACTRVVYDEKFRNTGNPFEKLAAVCQKYYGLTKIRLLEFYLWWVGGVLPGAF